MNGDILQTYFTHIEIYLLDIYAFSRCFYPKELKAHSVYIFFCQYVCSLGIETTTFALLTRCSTTEPQEHLVSKLYFEASVRLHGCWHIYHK